MTRVELPQISWNHLPFLRLPTPQLPAEDEAPGYQDPSGNRFLRMSTVGEFTLLADEKFDFDISLSPTSAKEDNEDGDDEVFVGPVKHKEKCVSAAIQLQESEKKTPPLNPEPVTWSPLSGDKYVEIFKEAHLLALQLECFGSDAKKEEPQPVPNPVVEKFVEESKTKLKLFDSFNEVSRTPVALKRETYCIQESPFHQLPPSMQKQTGGSKTEAESTNCQKLSQNLSSPLKVPKVAKKLTMSPLAQKAKAPQAKSTVPPLSTGKTVSRLQPLKAPIAQTKNSLAVEQPKAAKKLSPARRRHPSSVGSMEDLCSANSSIASDISESSFNNSNVGQSKKTINPPSKMSLNKMQFKTPGTGFRRNTSSSSSSRSSVNTSLNSSVSSPPAASAKLNATLNMSVSSSMNNSRLKANAGRLALVRPLGGLGSTLKTATTDLSKSHLKPVAATNAKANGNKSSSVSVAQPESPAGKVQRQTSAPNLRRLPPPPAKPESAVKALAIKPQARVMPTPTSRLKPPQKTDGMSPDRAAAKTLKPMRLLSCGDIGSGISQSTPIPAAKGKPANSNLPARCIPATPSSKLTSALPTPVSRRTSGVLATPRTLPRTSHSLRPIPALQATRKSPMVLPAGSAEGEQKKPKAPKTPCSPTEDNTTTAEICCSLKFSPENKTVPLAHIANAPASQPQDTEITLIDIGVDKVNTKVRKPSESQPLMDLSNTPEMSKQPIPLKPTNITQLIDLSSPLIKLSPAANKENMEFDSPLLKF
ncbi:G2 and S phase-expressed protein 1 [Gastrophryne carolinensis]